MKITELIREEITIGEHARLSMIRICKHFINNNMLSKDEFFELMKDANNQLKEYMGIKIKGD